MVLQNWLKKSIFSAFFRFFPVALLASAADAALLWGIKSFMGILSGEPVFGLRDWVLLMVLLCALRFFFMLWKIRISENWIYGACSCVMGWFLRTLRNLSPRVFHGPDGERAVEVAYESTQVLQTNGAVCFQALQAVLQLLVFLPVLFYISWPLTLFLFVVIVPVIAWMQRKIHGMGPEEESLLEMKSAFRQDLVLARVLFRQWSSRGENEQISTELLTSIRTLKNKGAAASVRKGSLSLVTETISVLAMVLVLAFCAVLISSGWMDGTGLVLYCSAVLLCYKPVKECSRVMPQMRSALSAYNILVKFSLLPKRRRAATGICKNGISVKQGAFGYEGAPLLFNNLSFFWDSSKPVLLRGKNGIGKSTLLRLAAGLEEWDSGCATRQDVFFVAQDLELPPRRFLNKLLNSIRRFSVEHGASASDADFPACAADRVCVLAEFVSAAGLSPILEKTGLSGGERSRVALLWALASESKIVLLDEPFASIALADREPLLSAFLNAAEALGKWTIIVSHDVLTAAMETRFNVVTMDSLNEVPA